MASGPISSWQIDGETAETVSDFIFLGSKITADGDCSHDIKRHLLLGRKVMTNQDSILKGRRGGAKRHLPAETESPRQSSNQSSGHSASQLPDLSRPAISGSPLNLFYISASVFLFCKQVSLYRFFRFHL